MNKNFKYYLTYWGILFALFNVISFVSVGWIGQEKYTPSFWIGYGFITLSFIGQLACAWQTFKAENLQKLFYNIPLLRTSYTGLIFSFIVGGACMLISPLPYWVGAILCGIVLVITLISALKASVAADAVASVETRIKAQTFFIKSLTVDAQTLLDSAEDDEVKAELKKVYEEIRYSDPMSGDALTAAESQITVAFAGLQDAAAAGDTQQVKQKAKEVLILVKDRNNKCKLLK